MAESSYTITLDDDPTMHQIIEKVTGVASRPFLSAQKLIDCVPELSPLGIFVDIHLGRGENGLDVIKALRDAWPFQPIVVMTADSSDDALTQALAAGADDFVRKPIQPKELLARFQARMTELAAKADKELVSVGDIRLDTLHKKLTGPKGNVYLSPTEMELLLILLQARGTVVQKDALKRRLWGEISVSDNALNRKIFEVRRAVEEVSSRVAVKSIYGVGLNIQVTDL